VILSLAEMDNQSEIIERARHDLAGRLGINQSEVSVISAEQTDFPDAALGAPVEDEMSAQVITPGLCIRLGAQNKSYEYRSAGGRLRLFDFNGENYKV
jgi:hypothetical protein